MVRKKSVASKAKTRKEAYKRKSLRSKSERSWRFLILVMKAVRIFLDSRRNSAIAASLPPNFGVLEPYFVPLNCIGFGYENVEITFREYDHTKKQTIDFTIVEDILKSLVSKVSRRESERMRQKRLRDKLRKEKEKRSFLIGERCIVQSNWRKTRQCSWYREKYHDNVAFRKEKTASVMNHFRRAYGSSEDFHRRHNTRVRNRYLNDADFYEKRKLEGKNEYHTNDEFRDRRKSQIRDKYRDNNEFRENRKDQIKRKYQMFVDFREKLKNQIRRKYQMCADFRKRRMTRINAYYFNKYHNNVSFRSLCRSRTKENMSKKYHYNEEFRIRHKTQMKERVMQKYRTDNLQRLKMINQALNHYQVTYTPMKQTQRLLYNQKRRIMKKYLAMQSHDCQVKHSNLYTQHLKEFRQLNSEGPDYICISCRLTSFRNQVIPYIEGKYKKRAYRAK